MTNKLRQSDARVRIANQKVEAIAEEISKTYDPENIEKTDFLIEILYMKTKAVRALSGVDRRAYACVKTFLDTFNLIEFSKLYKA